MRNFSVIVISLLLSFASSKVNSADIMFPEEQFGAIDLVPRQSSAQSALETLGALTDRFELVAEFPDDDPIRQLGRPIGRLDILIRDGDKIGVATCTAAIIDEDKIITNHHCIPGDEGSEIISAKIRLGYLELESQNSEAYDVEIDPLETDQSLDYSILKVNGNPAALFGRSPIAPRQARASESLFLIHYPGGQPQRLTRAYCRAMRQATVGNELRHRCDTLPGSSGSLVFSQRDYSLVGLHRAGGLAPRDTSSFNRATDALALYQNSPLIRSICCSSSTPPAPTDQAPNRADSAKGWIFLGRYSRGRWLEPRSGYLSQYSPEQLDGSTLTLSRDVNLHAGPYRVTSVSDGKCEIEGTDTTGTLAAGRTVKIIRSIRLERCSSYVWALIE